MATAHDMIASRSETLEGALARTTGLYVSGVIDLGKLEWRIARILELEREGFFTER